MRVAIAVDSFKGCLSSMAAGQAVREGVLGAAPGSQVHVCALADGGEGTIAALCGQPGTRLVEVPVTGADGRMRTGHYGVLAGGRIAVLEAADAAGLAALAPEARNPLRTTSLGLGQTLKAALDAGMRDFIIGLGGSSTNDCGLGMLTALGFRFLRADGSPAGVAGASLGEVAAIDVSAADPRLAGCRLRIACDVTNPLLGPDGAAAVYGPQKGASPEEVALLDAAAARFARLAEDRLGVCCRNLAGAGAAGGLGFAFTAFLGGQMVSGAQLVLSAVGFEDAVRGADLVFTGEGRIDGQSAMGKAPAAVAGMARRLAPRAKVVALCGCVGPGAQAVHACGIDACFPIQDGPVSARQAMDAHRAAAGLARTAGQVVRLCMPRS